MKFAFSEISIPKRGSLAVALYADKTFSPTATLVDKKTKGALSRALETSRFTGKKGDFLEIVAPNGLDVSRVVLFGLGETEKLTMTDMETDIDEAAEPTLARMTVSCKGSATARKVFADIEALNEGVFMTRDLVSEPANELYPESFAARCLELSDMGVHVEILDEAKMQRLGRAPRCRAGLPPRQPPRRHAVERRNDQEGRTQAARLRR